VSTRSIRAELAADPDLGAGNVLTTLVARGTDPDSPGLAFDTPVDGHPAGHPLTLSELDRAVRARAGWFAARGIRARQPVAIYATGAADQVLNELALMRLGAIPAPLNGALPAVTAVEYVGRLRPVGVLTDAPRRATLLGADLGAPLLGTTADTGGGDPALAPEPYRHGPNDAIAITHSSGTTGAPKAVVHAHRTLFASVRHRLAMPMAHETEVMLSALPTPHSATIIAVNLALCNRSRLLALSTQDSLAVLAAIEKWRPGLVLGFSVTWAGLARLDLTDRDLASVQTWWNTGDAAHETHIRRLVAVGYHKEMTRQGPIDVPGSRFIDGLGSTEMGHSMFHITHRKDTNRYGRCIGRPHLYVDVAVVDPDGNRLPAGEFGELAVRSPTLAPGYWNDSVTTYRTRWHDYFLTGDVVYEGPGGYYYHVDRVADAVDLGGGKRLYTALSEERILAACPDVVDCTVSAVRHDDAVVTDVLLILDRDADPAIDRGDAVLAALEGHVAATVRRVASVRPEDVPVTVTGKVRKRMIRESQVGDTVAAAQ
jgi:acyl-coenzyme A synthetase/AMP-(fatty) acid ligase